MTTPLWFEQNQSEFSMGKKIIQWFPLWFQHVKNMVSQNQVSRVRHYETKLKNMINAEAFASPLYKTRQFAEFALNPEGLHNEDFHGNRELPTYAPIISQVDTPRERKCPPKDPLEGIPVQLALSPAFLQ